mgnify:CR=1 FL=1
MGAWGNQKAEIVDGKWVFTYSTTKNDTLGLVKLQAINEAIVLKELTGSSKPKEVIGDEIQPNKGELKIDATCTPVDVSFSSNLSLLNKNRLNSERIIDKI